MKKTLISAGVGGLIGISATLLSLYLGPSITKSIKANEIRNVYREYARLNIKSFFESYDENINILNDIPEGILQSFSSAEEVNPLTEIIKENLGFLKSKEILVVAIVLSKEYQMASRRRGLNYRMEEIRAKKILDSSAKITNELQDIKAAIESYNKWQIVHNTLIYQGLASLGVDSFIYSDGITKTHKEIFEFWNRINNGEKLPDNLVPYIPWGTDEIKT